MSDDEGDSDFSEIESSEDDLVLLGEHRPKNQNYLEETIPHYSNESFFEHFRLSREVVADISDRFQNSQYFNNQPGQYGNILPENQILIFLWYIGHQTACFRDVADRFNVTISSINRIIRRVTYFLSNLSPEIIKWPNNAEKRINEEHFRTNGFPNVIGSIDGSHIKIDKPENDPDSYLNRKGFYSIQMQAVCDHNNQILDVFIGYPRSVHDSRVFRNSPLKNNLEEKCGQYFLLGDSGYSLQPNLLTPYKDRGNLTRRQENYNLKLAKNRYVIEHCFGILKQKFRQLYHTKLRNIRFIVHFIRAACVLHNIGRKNDFLLDYGPEPEEPNNEEDEENGDELGDEADDIGAQVVRNRVANMLPM